MRMIRGTLVGATILASCVDEDPGSDPETPCAATEPIATGGDDYGLAWEPPVLRDLFDGTPKLDVATSWDFPGASGTSWQLDSLTGIYYRPPTDDEVAENGWHPRWLLVAAPDFVRDVTQGETMVTVPVPIMPLPGDPDQTIVIDEVDVELYASNNSITFVETRYDVTGGVTHDATRPTFYTYLQPSVSWDFTGEDRVLGVVGDESGGVTVQGALVDRSFALHGPFHQEAGIILLDSLPPRGGGTEVLLLVTDFGNPLQFAHAGAPEAPSHVATLARAHDDFRITSREVPFGAGASTGQCTDGYDNDPDGRADTCDYSCVPHYDFGGGDFDHVRVFEQTKNFGLFPDAMFCTENQHWENPAYLLGQEAAQTLHWINDTVPTGDWRDPCIEDPEHPEAWKPYDFGKRVPPIRMRMAGCFPFDTLSAAETCHFSGTCPGASAYPYEGVGEEMESGEDGYLARVWDAVDLAATGANQDNEDAFPISIAVALTSQSDATGIGGNPFKVVEGLAYTTFEEPNPGLSGAAAAWWTRGNSSASALRIAHEMGHLLGLPHDNGQYCPEPGTCYPGLMNDGGGTQPVLGEPSETPNQPFQCRHPYQIWTSATEDKDFPRSSGFKHTGCSGGCGTYPDCDDGCYDGYSSLHCNSNNVCAGGA